jgi:hypothetical protein
MVQYARVDDNEVKEVKDCPKNYKNVSNFYLLSDEEKIIYGWYPVEEINVTPKDWESFGDYVHQIESNKVIRSRKIHSITLDEYKERKCITLSSNTKMYVYSVYDIHKQLSAAMGNYSTEENEAIKSFTNKHKDEVRRLKVLIENATTFEQVEQQPNIVEYEV